MEKNILLDIQHIEVSYNRKPVINNLSLQVRTGEILGIVGESGSGKSTIVKAAIGLLGKDGTVTSGNIFYKGKNILNIKNKDMIKIRGSEMGMIFQNTEASLCPIRRIEDQLYECVMQHENTTKQNIKDRALELFDKMKLRNGERILKSYPFELSGGMNQRVGIMMAMILKPDLLFADEPTSALDVTVQAQVIKELIEMRRIFNTAIVIVTHNIGIVEYMADTVAVMYKGNLIEYGTTDNVIHKTKQEYTKKLIGSVLKINRG